MHDGWRVQQVCYKFLCVGKARSPRTINSNLHVRLYTPSKENRNWGKKKRRKIPREKKKKKWNEKKQRSLLTAEGSENQRREKSVFCFSDVLRSRCKYTRGFCAVSRIKPRIGLTRNGVLSERLNRLVNTVTNLPTQRHTEHLRVSGSFVSI